MKQSRALRQLEEFCGKHPRTRGGKAQFGRPNASRRTRLSTNITRDVSTQRHRALERIGKQFQADIPCFVEGIMAWQIPDRGDELVSYSTSTQVIAAKKIIVL